MNIAEFNAWLDGRFKEPENLSGNLTHLAVRVFSVRDFHSTQETPDSKFIEVAKEVIEESFKEGSHVFWRLRPTIEKECDFETSDYIKILALRLSGEGEKPGCIVTRRID